jgi:hypothetical protein
MQNSEALNAGVNPAIIQPQNRPPESSKLEHVPGDKWGHRFSVIAKTAGAVAIVALTVALIAGIIFATGGAAVIPLAIAGGVFIVAGGGGIALKLFKDHLQKPEKSQIPARAYELLGDKVTTNQVNLLMNLSPEKTEKLLKFMQMVRAKSEDKAIINQLQNEVAEGNPEIEGLLEELKNSKTLLNALPYGNLEAKLKRVMHSDKVPNLLNKLSGSFNSPIRQIAVNEVINALQKFNMSKLDPNRKYDYFSLLGKLNALKHETKDAALMEVLNELVKTAAGSHYIDTLNEKEAVIYRAYELIGENLSINDMNVIQNLPADKLENLSAFIHLVREKNRGEDYKPQDLFFLGTTLEAVPQLSSLINKLEDKTGKYTNLPYSGFENRLKNLLGDNYDLHFDAFQKNFNSPYFQIAAYKALLILEEYKKDKNLDNLDAKLNQLSTEVNNKDFMQLIDDVSKLLISYETFATDLEVVTRLLNQTPATRLEEPSAGVMQTDIEPKPISLKNPDTANKLRAGVETPILEPLTDFSSENFTNKELYADGGPAQGIWPQSMTKGDYSIIETILGSDWIKMAEFLRASNYKSPVDVINRTDEFIQHLKNRNISLENQRVLLNIAHKYAPEGFPDFPAVQNFSTHLSNLGKDQALVAARDQRGLYPTDARIGIMLPDIESSELDQISKHFENKSELAQYFGYLNLENFKSPQALLKANDKLIQLFIDKKVPPAQQQTLLNILYKHAPKEALQQFPTLPFLDFKTIKDAAPDLEGKLNIFIRGPKGFLIPKQIEIASANSPRMATTNPDVIFVSLAITKNPPKVIYVRHEIPRELFTIEKNIEATRETLMRVATQAMVTGRPIEELIKETDLKPERYSAYIVIANNIRQKIEFEHGIVNGSLNPVILEKGIKAELSEKDAAFLLNKINEPFDRAVFLQFFREMKSLNVEPRNQRAIFESMQLPLDFIKSANWSKNDKLTMLRIIQSRSTAGPNQIPVQYKDFYNFNLKSEVGTFYLIELDDDLAPDIREFKIEKEGSIKAGDLVIKNQPPENSEVEEFFNSLPASTVSRTFVRDQATVQAKLNHPEALTFAEETITVEDKSQVVEIVSKVKDDLNRVSYFFNGKNINNPIAFLSILFVALGKSLQGLRTLSSFLYQAINPASFENFRSRLAMNLFMNNNHIMQQGNVNIHVKAAGDNVLITADTDFLVGDGANKVITRPLWNYHQQVTYTIPIDALETRDMSQATSTFTVSSSKIPTFELMNPYLEKAFKPAGLELFNRYLDMLNSLGPNPEPKQLAMMLSIQNILMDDILKINASNPKLLKSVLPHLSMIFGLYRLTPAQIESALPLMNEKKVYLFDRMSFEQDAISIFVLIKGEVKLDETIPLLNQPFLPKDNPFFTKKVPLNRTVSPIFLDYSWNNIRNKMELRDEAKVELKDKSQLAVPYSRKDLERSKFNIDGKDFDLGQADEKLEALKNLLGVNTPQITALLTQFAAGSLKYSLEQMAYPHFANQKPPVPVILANTKDYKYNITKEEDGSIKMEIVMLHDIEQPSYSGTNNVLVKGIVSKRTIIISPEDLANNRGQSSLVVDTHEITGQDALP